MVNKDSHFADSVRFRPHTYTCTQQSLSSLWAAVTHMHGLTANVRKDFLLHGAYP